LYPFIESYMHAKDIDNFTQSCVCFSISIQILLTRFVLSFYAYENFKILNSISKKTKKNTRKTRDSTEKYLRQNEQVAGFISSIYSNSKPSKPNRRTITSKK